MDGTEKGEGGSTDGLRTKQTWCGLTMLEPEDVALAEPARFVGDIDAGNHADEICIFANAPVESVG